MNSHKRFLWLVTIVGFVVPNAMVVAFMVRNNFSMIKYFRAWVETLPAAQLTADLGITVTAFLAWSRWESQRLGMRHWWLTVPATFGVGICFSAPMFLLMREYALDRAAA